MNLEFSGLLDAFRKNIPLSEMDRKLQLQQKEALDYTPRVSNALIKLNSTYLELTDMYYDSKGFLFFFGLLLFIIGCFVAFTIPSILIYQLIDPPLPPNEGLLNTPGIIATLVTLLVGSGWMWFCWRMMLSKDSFRNTHYPIRFNRKNRMVYVHMLDGSIISEPWDRIFFTICRGSSSRTGTVQYWHIRGHLLDKDGVKIKETFALPWVDSNPDGNLLHNWEFVRRYMEEGPGKVTQKKPYCLPIAEAKETLAFSYFFYCGQYVAMFPSSYGKGYNQNQYGKTRLSEWFSVLFSPFLMILYLSALSQVPMRWLSIKTCRVPLWTKEIEEVSQIEAGDQFVFDHTTNSPMPPEEFWAF